VKDAIAIGENLIEIPRHPKLNKIDDGAHAGREGRSRLFEVLTRWELWDQLLDRSTTILAPSGNDDDEVKRLRALGAAYFAKNDAESGRICIAGLEVLLRKATGKPAPEKDEKDDKKKEEGKKSSEKKTKSIENALSELRGLAEPDPKAALDHFAKCEDLPKETLARAQLRAGDKEKAEKTAKQAAEAAEGQALPGLAYVELLLELGKRREAEDAWKKLAPILRHADPGLPPLRRLEEFAAAVKIELPEDKSAISHIENLGPLAWAPSEAPRVVTQAGELDPFKQENCGEPGFIALFYLGSK